MSRTLAYVGLVLGILAIATGLSALFFDNYIYPYLDYDSNLNSLSTLFWFLNTLLVGLAVCFVAMAVALWPKPEPASAAAVSPPALPSRGSLIPSREQPATHDLSADSRPPTL